MIKWSVVFSTESKLPVFTQSLSQLIESVDSKRTEFLLTSVKPIDPLYREIFDTSCRQAKITSKVHESIDINTVIADTQGEYVAVVRDHVLVPKNFLSRLTFCMDNFERTYNQGPIGIVGPITNGGSGPQRIGMQANLHPHDVNGIQKKLEEQLQGQHPWQSAATLESFCFMFRRDAYNQVGAFDFTVEPDFALVEWITRAMRFGWKAAAASDVYVYRSDEGLPLMDWNRVYKSLPEGNRIPQKLAFLHRIKLYDDFERDIFIESLGHSLAVGDAVFILDDNSLVKMGLYLKEECPDIWNHPKLAKYQKYSRPLDEKRDWNELMDWAEKAGMNWAFAVDGDEVVEDKVTRDYLESLMHPVNPQVMGYFVHPYYFWDSCSKWRMDGIWGETHDLRLIRINPGQRIGVEGVLATQCGYVSQYPGECIRTSSIRLKVYGSVFEAQRERVKILHEKNVRGATPNQFNYLVSTSNCSLYPWQEANTVSVYAPVNRGGVLLYEWLDAVVPFADEVVIGDSGLSAEDKKLLTDVWGVRVVPIWDKPEDFMAKGFAESRNKVIKECRQSYILQLDIDEKIEDWHKVRRMMDLPTHPAWDFQVLNYQRPPTQPVLTSTTRLFQNAPGVHYWGYLHETIDNAVHELGWRVGQSPTKVLHFGFAITPPAEMFKKMQKYLELNLRQMEDFPDDPRAYYNLALHLVEDGLVEDAIRVLKIAVPLSGRFPLPIIELAKLYLFTSRAHFNGALRMLQPSHASHATLAQTCKDLEQVTSNMNHVPAAPGHCLSFFTTQPKNMERVRLHCDNMERHIEQVRAGQLKKK